MSSSIDHKFDFEDRYNRQRKRDEERGRPEVPKDANGFPLPPTAETSHQNSFLLNDRKMGNSNDDDSDNASPMPT